jgi:hypothetical protein
MNAISLLVELQSADLQSDENARARAEMETKLTDSIALDAARLEMDASAAQLAALETQLRDLELETGGLTEKLKQVNERLYSGRITNAKELSGLNDDEKMLQKRKRELEDRELALMEQIENAGKLQSAKRARYQTLSTQTNAQHDQARAALLRLDASDAELAHKRETLRAQLDAQTLRTYDHLRATKKGRAIASIKHASCGQCGYAIPGGLISRIKLGSELVVCTNCERILAP